MQGMTNILKQWDTAPEGSKTYYIRRAQEYTHWTLAQQILKKPETAFLATRSSNQSIHRDT
jgi:hypothetical protein